LHFNYTSSIEKLGSDELKNAIADGDVSIHTAYDIAKLSEDEQSETVENIKAEKAEKTSKKGKKSAPKSQSDDDKTPDVKADFKAFVKEWTEQILSAKNFFEIAEELKTELSNFIEVRK
jgi:DNA invertase Pin-like site-specific DNA recombinase